MNDEHLIRLTQQIDKLADIIKSRCKEVEHLRGINQRYVEFALRMLRSYKKRIKELEAENEELREKLK